MSTWRTETGARLVLDDSMSLGEHRRFVSRVYEGLDVARQSGWTLRGFGFELSQANVSDRHELRAAAYGEWREES